MGACEVMIQLDDQVESNNCSYRVVDGVEQLRGVIAEHSDQGREVVALEFAQLMWPASSSEEIPVGQGWWCVENQTRFERRES